MVVYITRYLDGPHGTAKSARDVLLAMLATDQRVRVVCPERCRTPASAAGFPLRFPEWRVPPSECIPFPSAANARFPRRVASWALRRLQWRRFRSSLGIGAEDLVLVNGWASHEFSGGIRSGTTARQILVVRESPRHFDSGDARWSRGQLRQGMEHYWGFIFVSDRCRREWMSLPSLGRKAAFHIPNCCQEEEAALILRTPRAEVRRRLYFPTDRFVIVCAATLEHRKGQDIVLDLMACLTRAIPRVLVLFVGGCASEYGASLVARIQNSPFAPGMAVLPQQKSALELIYAADALILPSRAEAMPRVVLEAMVLGTPVVASDVDGIPELIEHRRSGFLFGHDRPLGLVEGLRVLADDRTVASAVAQCARERYWANFSRAHLIRRYTQVITDLLNGHREAAATRAGSGTADCRGDGVGVPRAVS